MMNNFPPEEGWKPFFPADAPAGVHYSYDSPYRYHEIEVHHADWPSSRKMYTSKQKLTNTKNVFWRPSEDEVNRPALIIEKHY